MGTDVYLEWEGKTEKEQEARFTGWDIGAGDVGYLRASIGMVNENALLRMVFAEKYWTECSKEPYDVKGSFEVLSELGFRYLVAVVSGRPMEMSQAGKAVMAGQRERGLSVMEEVKKACERQEGAGGVAVRLGEIREFRDAVRWLESLFCFFDLGVEKQEAGLKPYPCISC